MHNSGSLQISRSQDAQVVRVLGKGTYTQSERFFRVVDAVLSGCDASVVVDLESCDYLDSTFLGCLVQLCKSHNREHTRFVIAASQPRQQTLFASSQLHKFLLLVDDQPILLEEWEEVDIDVVATADMGQHVMRCHRIIGDMDVPDRDKFSKIADSLEAELPSDDR